MPFLNFLGQVYRLNVAWQDQMNSAALEHATKIAPYVLDAAYI